MNAPLVSCAMPTANRRAFIPGALGYFLAQDYPNKELLVLDDGTDSVEDLMPKDSRVRYFREEPRRNTGLKRNTLCELARGDIIAQFDDDDWYAPDRLSCQVAEIQSGVDLVGLCDVLFYDTRGMTARAWRYTYRGARPWTFGPTMMYTRALWEKIKFKDTCENDDTLFVWSCDPTRVRACSGAWHVATLHNRNGSAKTIHAGWKEIPVKRLPGKVAI